MSFARGFPPVQRGDALVLVLGSMPSRESLAQQRYYAHPRNAFWPIVTELLEIPADDYAGRCEGLRQHRVALWDVLQACFRSGSLDSAIDDSSIVTNDFAGFFDTHRELRRVYFNGAKSESLYRKHVLPGLPARAAALPMHRLPSTSPAHASMNLQQKREAWRVIVEEGLRGLE